MSILMCDYINQYWLEQKYVKIYATYISGADNETNCANCDTSTKFGTNVLWGKVR